MWPLLGLLVVAAALGAVTTRVASPKASAPPFPAVCRGADLDGTFTAVRGSAGAGQIEYLLRVVDVSPTACLVSGVPQLQLLDRRGRTLPTNAMAAHPGMLTAVRVALEPYDPASLTARFSPDVPGVGEPQSGRCEPRAFRARVTVPGGSSFLVPVTPPTAVCEHGRMRLSGFARAR